MSERIQPDAVCIGSTNSNHAYCRLAIMIIASSEAQS